jgi:hypothetical protein
MTPSDLKAILEIYEEFEKRKAAKKISFAVLFSDKKWYQFWKK